VNELDVLPEEVNRLYERLNNEAESGGYHLNHDADVTREIVKGLLANTKRYGYQSCPCRLASGKKEEDLDIICPCDYRDRDLGDYDTCYCGLYVSQAVVEGKKKIGSIPERRLPIVERIKHKTGAVDLGEVVTISHPVWRCNVCGYLCARESPPEICPICKARKERFSRFL